MNSRAINNVSQASASHAFRLPELALVSKCLPSKLFLLALLIFLLPQTAYFQNNDLFEVKNLTVDIKHRFRLNASDLKAIERLIEQQNRSIVRIYARFSGGEPEYSSRLWRQIIDDRVAFEAGIDPSLTSRQRQALRSARAQIEKRILESLARDYVGFLSQILELGDFESNDVADLFEEDVKKKCRVLVIHSPNPTMMQKEIENLIHETERKLRRILSDENLKRYRELTEPFKVTA